MATSASSWLRPWLIIASASWCCYHLVSSFNLEPRLAIVKEGTAGTYFGYSVAQHQIRSGPDRRRGSWDSVLLVGAPRGRNGRGVEEGTVWRCPFSMRPDDCTRLRVDSPGDGGGSKAASGQWLGSVVYSQGPGTDARLLYFLPHGQSVILKS